MKETIKRKSLENEKCFTKVVARNCDVISNRIKVKKVFTQQQYIILGVMQGVSGPWASPRTSHYNSAQSLNSLHMQVRWHQELIARGVEPKTLRGRKQNSKSQAFTIKLIPSGNLKYISLEVVAYDSESVTIEGLRQKYQSTSISTLYWSGIFLVFD